MSGQPMQLRQAVRLVCNTCVQRELLGTKGQSFRHDGHITCTYEDPTSFRESPATPSEIPVTRNARVQVFGFAIFGCCT